MDQSATLYSPGRIALDGDPSTPKKGGTAVSTFRSMYCGQTDGWIKTPLGTEVGLGTGHIVLDWDPALPTNGHSPHFSAHVYCGQTAGWIKMPVCTAPATLC